MSQRSDRVSDMLRSELSNILMHEMKDPRVRLATVSRIEVSRDLSHAQVYISVLGEDEESRQECLRTLERAKGFLRSTLGRRVRLRTVPALELHLDRGAEHSMMISELLVNLDDGEPSP
ncbi:MAG: 30S ribosome-binding factor RbfA [Acidobacteriota bacterium]